MTISKQDFSDNLDRHGADPKAWPAERRDLCLALLEQDPGAQKLWRQHQQLADALDQLVVPPMPGLAERILKQSLPVRTPSLIDQVFNWLFPARPFSTQFWRPALAACLPLVIGVVVGNYFSFGVTGEIQGFEYWDDELFVLSLNDYTESLF